MRKSFLLFACFVYCGILRSQFNTIAESPALPEPEEGFAKIMQLQNGNTFFIHAHIKKGMDIKMFDSGRRLTVDKHFDLSYKNMDKAGVKAIFESQGDVVVLLSEFLENIQVLYRVIIDGRQGSLKEDKKIAEVPLAKKVEKFLDGGVSWRKDFIEVRKDPYSDNYAVVMLNKIGISKHNHLEAFDVILYNSAHEEKFRSTFSSPRSSDISVQYHDLALLGDGKIFVVVSGFTAENLEKGRGEIYLMTVEANATKPSIQPLSLLPATRLRKALLRYNPYSNKLVLLAAGRLEDNNNGEHDFLVAYVDPSTKKVERKLEPFPVHANEKSIELFGKKQPFTGLPQNIYFNADGSFTIIYEEMTSLCDQYSCNTELGNIAVLIFDKGGRAGNSYFIAKRQFNVSDLEMYYPAHRDGNAQYLRFGDQFKSFAYLNGKEKSYLLLNDIEENEATVLKGKVTKIVTVTECHGFYYTLSGLDIFPRRGFVFGKPAGKDKNSLALFTVSNYDPEKNVYVTLKLERDGKSKTARLVWLQPN